MRAGRVHRPEVAVRPMRRLCWPGVALLFLILLPVFLVRFLPFHDYANGVFQGYVLNLA